MENNNQVNELIKSCKETTKGGVIVDDSNEGYYKIDLIISKNIRDEEKEFDLYTLNKMILNLIADDKIHNQIEISDYYYNKKR